ncbi:acetyl-CoA carboxylase [uncultured Gemella sp.]|uniref:acetyl-CoA carboxylase n=1 Tax=uncultured Gemella sp. TaxID=254352 RepID=UPI0028E8ACD9|nr:acetyl-CoA carboxylase [uncultured Gemella sp.]
MLKNILDNVLSSGSNESGDKIKELINNIIGGNQAPSFVTEILNKALEQLNQGAGSALVAPMINKVLESYSMDNSLSNDMNELFKLTSNDGISNIAGNIINTLIKK